MNELDKFLQVTEDTSVTLAPTNTQAIRYPFLYLTEITEVEIAHLVSAQKLFREPKDASCLGVYLKSNGYTLLGYVKLGYSSIIHLNYLREHRIMLKAAKDKEQCVTEELFSSLLLSD